MGPLPPICFCFQGFARYQGDAGDDGVTFARRVLGFALLSGRCFTLAPGAQYQPVTSWDLFMRYLLVVMMVLGGSAYADTLIHAGRLVDVVEGKILSEQTIRIEGDRIAAVEPGFITDADARVVDLSDATVMPGFMDMHVHLLQELNPPASYAEGF